MFCSQPDANRPLRSESENAAARAAEETLDVSLQPEGAVPAAQSLDLATLLWLVDGQNPQVALARERISEAYAQSDRAKSLWLPSIRAGLNYNKHEGAIQDVAGKVFDTSRGSMYGGLGGGLGSEITHAGDRLDADAAAYWELRQLGLGEHAVRAEASSRVRQAELRQAADLDRVAEEVVTAHAQVQTRSSRIEIVRAGIRAAEESFRLNWDRIQNARGLPIEVLQSIQSLALVRREYLNAVVDYNIAQFQLWWAVGWFSEPPASPPGDG